MQIKNMNIVKDNMPMFSMLLMLSVLRGHCYNLPNIHRYALLLHEIGHLLAGPNKGEAAADKAAYDYSGIHIRYRNSKYGKMLETIDSSDVTDAKRALGL